MEGAATSSNILAAQMNPLGNRPKKKPKPKKEQGSKAILQALLESQAPQTNTSRSPL